MPLILIVDMIGSKTALTCWWNVSNAIQPMFQAV